MAKERKRLINEDLVQDVPAGGQQPGRDNPGQDRDRVQVRGNRIVDCEETNRPDLLK